MRFRSSGGDDLISVWGLGSGVWGLGFTVQGSGCRSEGFRAARRVGLLVMLVSPRQFWQLPHNYNRGIRGPKNAGSFWLEELFVDRRRHQLGVARRYSLGKVTLYPKP